MEDTKTETAAAANNKKKREDKLRRKDFRALDNILKEMKDLEGPEKVAVFASKYSDLYEEWRTSQTNLATAEKKCTVLQREKDQLQTEQSKQVLARSRLEGVCRELQRQNKLTKEENLAKIREEEERRKEVSSKFQNTLAEVTNMMHENSEKNIKLRDDNLDMANKLESLCEQFEQRKDQLCRVEHQMALERQLSEATLAKADFKQKAEREMWLNEKEILQSNLKKSEETCVQLHANIKALEDNLQLYSGKYQEFETTINKSNQVFDNCKSEMLKMTKQIATLEKESRTWKQRWQKNAQSVLELSTNKQTQDAKLDASERKLDQLQKLCRQLQVDRAAFLKLLKTNGIEPVSQTCGEEHSCPQTSSQIKSKIEIELEHLKDNLQALQDKLTNIQTDVPNKSEGVCPSEVPKSHVEEIQVTNAEKLVMSSGIEQTSNKSPEQQKTDTLVTMDDDGSCVPLPLNGTSTASET